MSTLALSLSNWRLGAFKGECGGRRAGGGEHSRHEKVGGDEPPGESRPPGLAGLVEGYTLDLAILSCAFALEKIAQDVSERGHSVKLEARSLARSR